MARATAGDALAAKERKKKKIAIAGAVLLVAVLGIQVPRTLKMLRGNSVSAPAATTSAQSNPAPGASAPASPDATASGGAQPLETTVKLVSFERFTRKDPFRPQIDEDAVASAGGSQAEPAKPERAAPKKPKPPAARRPAPSRERRKARPRVKVAAPGNAKPTRPATVTLASAVISVNGAPGERVAVGAAFPESDKLFRLVSLKPGVAKIGVVGGSLVGAKTASLVRGKSLTLVNTADGARYRIRLLAVA